MDKLFIKFADTSNLLRNVRKKCIVECPDCQKQREIRYDAFLNSETTCCRSCTNLRRPVKSIDELFNWKDYYHSKEGKLAHIYQQQKQRCNLKGWPLPTYTQKELLDWGMSLPQFHILFDAWESSGYLKNLSPSVDRLDDYLSYSLSNIQMISWEENNKKGYKSQISGTNTKNCIAIDQFTMEGEFIRRFHSLSDAKRATNISASKISEVCKGVPVKKGNRLSTPISAGGFIWKYSSIPNPLPN